MKKRYLPVVFADIILTFISVLFAGMLRYGVPQFNYPYLSLVLPFMLAAMILRPVIFAVETVKD